VVQLGELDDPDLPGLQIGADHGFLAGISACAREVGRGLLRSRTALTRSQIIARSNSAKSDSADEGRLQPGEGFGKKPPRLG
jgi:hypothetical protein